MWRRVGTLLGGVLATGLIAAVVVFRSGGPALAQEQQASPERAQRGAFLGVAVADVTPAIKERFGLQVDSGVVVVRVAPHGAAAEAGMQRGDLILAFDGTNVSSATDLARLVGNAQPGQTIALQISRSGSEQTLNVTLGERTWAVRMPGRLSALSNLVQGRLAEGTLTFVDEDGTRSTLTLVAGEVTAVAEQSLTIEPRGAQGQSRTFSVPQDARVLGGRLALQSLAVGDQVIVVTRDDPNTAVLVARGGLPFGWLGHKTHPAPAPGAFFYHHPVPAPERNETQAT